MEETDDLFIKDSHSYFIRITERKNGHYYCIYRVKTLDQHKMYESSARKIWLRLFHAFYLYIDELTESQLKEILIDLEKISKKLTIPGEFVATEMEKLGK